MRHQHRDRRITLEGRFASQQLKEHHAQTVQIRAPVHFKRIDLLGAHVGRRTHQHAGLGQPRRLRILMTRDTEIGQHRRHRIAEHDVGRLQITMHHAVIMSKLQRATNLHHDGHRFTERQTRSHVIVQGAALEVLHRDVGGVFAFDDVIDGDDIAMRQFRQRAPFHEEALLELLGVIDVTPHHLERDFSIERTLDRQMHGRHAADAQLADQLIAGNVDGRGWAHGARDGFVRIIASGKSRAAIASGSQRH